MSTPPGASAAERARGEQPKVVYVMGTARSGSTILGVALGNCDGVFYAGELGGWLVKAGVPTLGGDERARFWASVRERVAGAQELFGSEAQRNIERSAALLRVRGRSVRRRLLPSYLRVARELYTAIARTAGVSHVVDTSSYPLRARALQGLDGVDLRLVYIVRDPHSVVASFTRSQWRFSDSVLLTNLYIWLTNLLAVLVFLRQPRKRRMFLRYEDFVADPSRTLTALLAAVDCPAALPDFAALQPGIPFQGNRLLRSHAPIALRGGAGATPERLRLTSVMQAPWNVVFARLAPCTSEVAS